MRTTPDIIEAVPPPYVENLAQPFNGYITHHIGHFAATPASTSTSPSAYVVTSQLTAYELLELAIADIDHQIPLDQHPFFARPERRCNPSSRVLYQQLNKESKRSKEAIYFDRSINHAISTPDLFLKAFFAAISDGAEDIVARVLDSGLVDANTPAIGFDAGLTPLLCAVQRRHNRLVTLLISRGARVDDFGVYRSWSDLTLSGSITYHNAVLESGIRTPIQLAASLGNLALVKILLDEFSADDSLVAPDGQIALRLAAENGHTEIVAFLPARRGGGFLRWKNKHYKSMKRIKESGVRLYKIGKFIVYDIPHFLATGLASGAKYAVLKTWKKRREIFLWCLSLPEECCKALREMPMMLIVVTVGLAELIRKFATVYIPEAVKLLGNILQVTGKALWDASAWVLNRMLSLMHTLLSAIKSVFQGLTLQNIVNGFKDLLHAIFVAFPKSLWGAMKKIDKLVLQVTKKLGDAIWVTACLVRLLAVTILKPIWKILTAIAGTTGAGMKEIHLFFDPKAEVV